MEIHSDLSTLKIKRGQLKSQITRLNNYFQSLSVNNLSDLEITQLKCRLDKINPVFSKFEEIQSDIELLCENENLLDTEEQERLRFEDSFYAIVSQIKNVVEEYDSKNQACNENKTMVISAPSQPQFKLPDVKIPVFNGYYDKWLEFRDSFLALVHTNADISPIQKFYYLRGFLAKEPLDLISSIEISADNYAVAWSMISERYENKKLIIFNYVTSLFEFPAISRESHTELRKLYDTFTKNLRSLKSLGEPIECWDTLIVYLITSKYDYYTRRAWESYPISADLPKWDDVARFLKTRCEILENLELTRPIKSGSSKFSQKSNFKTNNKEGINSFTTTTRSFSCFYCKKEHSIYQCDSFKKLDFQSRLHQVNQLKLCKNCFNPNHDVQQCKKSNCRICQKRHNTMLCNKNSETCSDTTVSAAQATTSQNKSEPQDTKNTSNDNSQTILASHVSINPRLSVEGLLSTALIKVVDVTGNERYARALLDPGSQSHLITESFAKMLGVKAQHVNCSISGVGDKNSVSCKFKVNISIKSNTNEFQTTISCLAVQGITQKLPLVTFDRSIISIPSDIQLADPNFNVQGDIDILIGTGLYYRLLIMEQLDLTDSLILQNTKLGWILGGEYPTNSQKRVVSCLSVNKSIDESLTRFWVLEECGKQQSSILTPEENYCEEHFVRNFKRNEQGRFIVNIPFKDNVNKLGDTKQMALHRFKLLERRLNKDNNLKRDYVSFMSEYIQLGHMSKISNLEEQSDDDHSNPCYYLPHHPVFKQSSTTTKCRVVFDASAISSSGLSLNDIQYAGPTIQDELFSLLVRFRCYNFVINADISKMYRQILIEPSERRYQRIFWREDCSKPIQVFELNTVTYGCSSSPFLACRTLHQLAYDNQEKYPEASHAILKDFYIDDLLTGADNIPDLICLQGDISRILADGGLELRKWLSNKPEIMSQFQVHDNLASSILHLGPNESTKTLGVFWSATNDRIQYSIRDFENQLSITKRTILSITSQIFDPLGLLGPIIISAKLILQLLWQEQLSWDEQVSTDLREKWLRFCNNMSLLNKISIPRHVLQVDAIDIELHAFSDASERAYGACIYLVCKDNSGQYHSQLLCAKSRVAPIKRISLPRLELCAALLLSRLVSKVRSSLNINVSQFYYWSDSTITLFWLKGCPSRWKTFVANRVSEIQELTDPNQWFHVSSEQNPADYLSRGTDPQILLSCELWWNGPSWLHKERHEFTMNLIDKFNLSETSLDIPDQKSHCYVTTLQRDFDFSQFSSFSRLKRIFAYCLRFVHNLRNEDQRLTGPLSSTELHDSMIHILRISQIQAFNNEYSNLKNKKELSSSNQLLCLNPFLDEHELIRVGGRLQSSNLSYQKKHPIILSDKHYVTLLIMRQEHERLLHCGPQQLLFSIRETFWPLCGRKLARSICRKCVICFKVKPTPCKYIMGNLPSFRVSQSPPFTNTGLDYAGPILLKDRKTRNPKLTKGYICLFICMSTKCIHLELVSDLTTEAFLATLQRFMARRGKPSVLFSDNATTFKGAYNEILKFFKRESKALNNDLASQGISWQFIPPRSPNFGGIWEGNIKQVKYHLKRILGNSHLTYEDFSTVLTQIEAILNSRPLCPLSSNHNDQSPLTPAHFLLGKSLTSLPEPCVLDVPISRLGRYQHLQSLIQHFWKRWHREYISELQSRIKWKRNVGTLLKVGSLVVIKEDNQPTLNWKLGRINELFPGSDGVCRVASIRCSDGTIIKRAISRLCVLPIDDNIIIGDTKTMLK